MEEQRDRSIFTEKDAATLVLDVMIEEHSPYGIVLSEREVPLGVIYLTELLKKINSGQNSHKPLVASDVMNRSFTVISEKTDLEELLSSELKDKTFPILVVDFEGKFAGILTKDNMIDLLHKNLRYTKQILDNVDEGIIAVDEQSNIAYINEPWKQIHSIKDEDTLIGERVTEKFPETKLGDVNIKNNNIASEPLHLNFSGATVLPFYKIITDDQKQSLGAMAIVKDYSKVNNLSISVNKINRLNLLFTSIFENLNESVFYIDKAYRIIYANREFIDTFGMMPGEVMKDGKAKRLIRDEFRLDKIDSFNKEMILQTKGGEKNMNVMGIPIFDAGQFLEGFVVILQDVTGLRNLKYEVERRGHLLEYYKEQINKIPAELICESEQFKGVISTALKVASANVSVLIEGENGVGKELIANLIHQNSDRSDRPFIPVNCGAIPDSLWESEMFGYEDGAFTGAKKGGKVGIFEMADGGTVFLDEIGELSLSAQVKMLRFLQNMEIAKVGRKEVKKIDVRIIAATNKNLKKMVEEEAFREDLYYRLNVIGLEVPALRKRTEEIQPLALRFVSMFNERYNKNVTISKGALALLKKAYWPGNIRQLRNTIEQSVIMCDDVIQPYDLPLDSSMYTNERDREQTGERLLQEDRWNLPKRVQNLEKEVIRDALEECNYNKSKVIELLHISRKTFYKKLKDYNL